MKKLVYFLILVTSCKHSKHGIKDEIFLKINAQDVGTRTQIIDLKTITPFQWDKLYVFYGWTEGDSIAKFIDIPYNKGMVPDDEERMIYVSEKKIIYEEDFPQADGKNNGIIFNFKRGTNLSYRLYSDKESSFYVKKEISKGNSTFVLTPTGNEYVK